MVTGLEGLRSLEVVEAVAQSAERGVEDLSETRTTHQFGKFRVTKKYPIVLKISCKNG